MKTLMGICGIVAIALECASAEESRVPFAEFERDVKRRTERLRPAVHVESYQLVFDRKKKLATIERTDGIYSWPRAKVKSYKVGIDPANASAMRSQGVAFWRKTMGPEPRPSIMVFDGFRKLWIRPVRDSRMYRGVLKKRGEAFDYMPVALRGFLVHGERWLDSVFREFGRKQWSGNAEDRRFVYVSARTEGTPSRWVLVVSARKMAGAWTVWRLDYYRGETEEVMKASYDGPNKPKNLDWLVSYVVNRFRNDPERGAVPELAEWSASYSEAVTICLISEVRPLQNVDETLFDVRRLPDELRGAGARVTDALTRTSFVLGHWRTPEGTSDLDGQDEQEPSIPLGWMIAGCVAIVGVLVAAYRRYAA